MLRFLLLSLIGAVVLPGCKSASVAANQSRGKDPSRFSYTRIYCTSDRESHFAEVTLDLSKVSLAPPAPPGYAGGSQPASSVIFAGVEAHWGADDLAKRLNHPAPAVQFVTVLQGDLAVTVTDGESRRFHVGDVIRVEDVAPCRGHITVAGDRTAFVMFTR